ncbi:MAG: amino acid adenylation domain-containing protein, partial [Acidobacteria bacterium]|nr:amino acid adenylation domain-containing protein [Acidobacteriota bacterium]
MTLAALLAHLRELDIKLRLDGDGLRFDAPAGVVTPELRAALKQRRQELIACLRDAEANQSSRSRIPRAPRGETIPVSFAQQRLWFVQQLAEQSPLYNMTGAVRLTGRLDAPALEAALRGIQQRHEILRTRFELADGEPVQRIGEAADLALTTIDLSDERPPGRERRIHEIARAWAHQTFDLARGPLFCAGLARLAETEHVLLLAFHHLVCDGWSIGVFVRELAALYDARVRGETEDPLPPLPIQYADFAAWQREWLAGPVLERQLAYWRRRLAAPLPSLELPTDRPRPPVQTFNGRLHHFVVAESTAERVAALARDRDATAFMALLAAFKVLLFRYTGQRDLIVGSPVASRTRAELEPLIGFFINNLPLRTRLAPAMCFGDLLERVREGCLEAYEHQDVPLEKLVEEIRPDRDVGRTPLYQAVFAMQTAPGGALRLPGLTIAPVETETGTARFDLTLSMTEANRRFAGVFEYNTDLFDADTIDRMGRSYCALLEAATARPDLPIAELPMLAPDDLERIVVGWNATAIEGAGEACAHERFEERAAREPDAIAVREGARQIACGELNAQANRLARQLRRLGVGAEQIVPLYLEPSIELVVAALAVMKAGGAYAPLDPQAPSERTRRMLEDCGAPIVLTSTSLAGKIDAARHRVLVDAAPGAVEETGGNLPRLATAAHCAYVIFTSGSTGTPKGVEVPHAGLNNLIDWHLRTYEISPADRATQLASVGFDACVWEIWPHLVGGAALHIADRETRSSPRALLAWMARERITVAFLPTPLAEAALQEPLPASLALRILLTGGDRLTAGARRSLPFAFVNHYGPTENSVVSTCGEVREARGDLRTAPDIGRPIANVQAYVLDDQLSPVAIGVVGELYVGGRSLARGYLKRPRETAAALVPNPFGDAPGSRLYRTGDLVRWQADGTIAFVGRRDGQVKIRGFRIELGEVEAALAVAPGVVAAAAAVHPIGGERRLIGYVVPAPGASVDPAAIRSAVERVAPAYMVPSAIVPLTALPLTANGKINRQALAPPAGEQIARSAYVAPRSALEAQIARVWADLLEVERVGVGQNFFDLGGHSLLLVK